jgi:hypothetical protein
VLIPRFDVHVHLVAGKVLARVIPAHLVAVVTYSWSRSIARSSAVATYSWSLKPIYPFNTTDSWWRAFWGLRGQLDLPVHNDPSSSGIQEGSGDRCALTPSHRHRNGSQSVETHLAATTLPARRLHTSPTGFCAILNYQPIRSCSDFPVIGGGLCSSVKPRSSAESRDSGYTPCTWRRVSRKRLRKSRMRA